MVLSDRKHSQDKPASVSFSVPSLLQKHEEHVVCVEVREEIFSLASTHKTCYSCFWRRKGTEKETEVGLSCECFL